MQITQIWDYYSYIHGWYTVMSVIFHSRTFVRCDTIFSPTIFIVFQRNSCSIFSLAFSLLFFFSFSFYFNSLSLLILFLFPFPLALLLSFRTPASDQQIEIALPMIGRRMRMSEKWKLESISRLEKKERLPLRFVFLFSFLIWLHIVGRFFSSSSSVSSLYLQCACKHRYYGFEINADKNELVFYLLSKPREKQNDFIICDCIHGISALKCS